jgi:hypothetical protein
MIAEQNSAMEEIHKFAKLGGLAPTRDVCRVTGYSSRYINRLCQSGHLKALKGKGRSSRWVIDRASVYEFFKNETVESGA